LPTVKVTVASLKFKPAGSVLREFMRDQSFVRGIRGPVGSGKSAGCCIEIFRRAGEQKPHTDGIRYTKWAVIRNTNPELKTTTIATWLDWFPENEWGKFRWSPPYTHHIKKGDIDLEVLFLPLDSPEDVKKLLSLEVTGIFVNEAREVPKAIIDGATMRVGRYPGANKGGCTWKGVIMDTNAPEEDHWWPILSGESPLPEHITAEQALMLAKPDNWKFFNQPAAMLEDKTEHGDLSAYRTSPHAENLDNLYKGYYENMIRGKMKSWIDVYVMNRLGVVEEGKMVYEGFTDKTHLTNTPLETIPHHEILIGMDFGLTPAAIFCQRLPNSRWLILRELVAGDMAAKRFSREIKHVMATYFPDHKYRMWADPSGDFRAQTDEVTPFQILRSCGIKATPAPSNDPVLRIESVSGLFARMVEGMPGVLIDEKLCPVFVAGLKGGYHYRRLRVSGERFDDRPNKNRYSHIQDAFQYVVMGAGEGTALLKSSSSLKPFVANRKYNVFDRIKSRRKQGLRSFG
jgi:hypothetical protein